jgi:hypothetical protein
MFQSALIDPVLFVRWRLQPSVEDIARLRHVVRRSSEKVGSLVYIAVIPVGVPPPLAPARDALREGLPEVRQLCASLHLIVEGEGVRRTLLRSILTGMLLESVHEFLHRRSGSQLHRASYHIHAGMREALTLAREKVGFDLEGILTDAKARDLFVVE